MAPPIPAETPARLHSPRSVVRGFDSGCLKRAPIRMGRPLQESNIPVESSVREIAGFLCGEIGEDRVAHYSCLCLLMAHTGNIASVDAEASTRPRRSHANAEHGATSIASVIPPSGGPIPACPHFVLHSVPVLPSTPSSADFFQGPRHVLASCCGSAALVTDLRRSTSHASRHSCGAASPASRAVRGVALGHRRDPRAAGRHGGTRWRVRRHDLDHHGRSPGQRDHHPGLGIDIRPIRHTPSRPGRSADADGGVDGLCLRSGPARSPCRPRGARDRPRRRRGRHRRGARRSHPPREQGRYAGYGAVVMAVSMAGGPLLGGASSIRPSAGGPASSFPRHRPP